MGLRAGRGLQYVPTHTYWGVTSLFPLSHSHSFVLPFIHPANIKNLLFMLVATPAMEPLLLDTFNKSCHKAVKGNMPTEGHLL